MEGSTLQKFRIVYYDELDDIFQLTSLYYLSLNWAVTPQLLEKKRQNDDRYLPEFGLFAVADDSTVIGGVFLMQIPTKTLEGKLPVGGLNAVATRPGYQRRGVMTTLINRCHRYFAERQLDYSFLTTSQTLGAHSMYKKLGYKNLVVRGIALKTPKKPLPLAKRIVVEKFKEGDDSAVYRTFLEATKDSYGFVYRPPDFLKARINGPFLRPSPQEKMWLAKHNDESIGYAYWEEEPHFAICTEVLALEEAPFVSLLTDAETRFQNKVLVIHCQGMSDREIGWLQATGYDTNILTYGVTMVKSIGGHTVLGDIKSLFGVNIGLFRMGVWDST